MRAHSRGDGVRRVARRVLCGCRRGEGAVGSGGGEERGFGGVEAESCVGFGRGGACEVGDRGASVGV